MGHQNPKAEWNNERYLPKLQNVLIKSRKSETKKEILNCYVIFILLYAGQFFFNDGEKARHTKYTVRQKEFREYNRLKM